MSKLEEITRREFCKAGVAAGVIMFIEEVTAQAALGQRIISYKEAVHDPNPVKIQDFLNQEFFGKIPDYVSSVEFATPALLKELKQDYGFEPNSANYAFALPFTDESGKTVIPTLEQRYKKAKSRVIVTQNGFVLPHIFFRVSLFLNPHRTPSVSTEDTYTDAQIIFLNGVRSQFEAARIYYEGLKGYPIEEFKDKHGRVNSELYKTLAELLVASAEYIGLISHPRFVKSKVMYYHLYETKKLWSNNYASALAKHEPLMSKQHIDRIKKDFNPEFLFPKFGSPKKI